VLILGELKWSGINTSRSVDSEQGGRWRRL
jgi:hypothetical protein